MKDLVPDSSSMSSLLWNRVKSGVDACYSELISANPWLVTYFESNIYQEPKICQCLISKSDMKDLVPDSASMSSSRTRSRLALIFLLFPPLVQANLSFAMIIPFVCICCNFQMTLDVFSLLITSHYSLCTYAKSTDFCRVHKFSK